MKARKAAPSTLFRGLDQHLAAVCRQDRAVAEPGPPGPGRGANASSAEPAGVAKLIRCKRLGDNQANAALLL